MRTAAAFVLALTASLSVVACSPDASNAPFAPTSASAPSPGAAVQLPTPTGQFAVGRDTLHLVDATREDPWTPGTPRELMVSMYYPAQSGGGAPAAYLTGAEIPPLLGELGIDKTEPVEILGAARTNSVEHAVPVDGSRPLVVLSPGFTAPRYTLTALAEELASRGTIVAAVDHAGESFGTEFPGGRLSTCVACQRVDAEGSLETVVQTRVRDVTFLLDRLTGAQPSWPHARLIDGARIGMAGHSIGGASSAAAMAADPRVRAGVNMDGSFWNQTPGTGLGDRPFLMLGTDADTRPGNHDPSWDRAWPELHGWKRWLTVVGADHDSFVDVGMLAEQAGLPSRALPGGRAVEITRAYVAAFFDQQLHGRAQALLDRQDPAYPEVRFNNP